MSEKEKIFLKTRYFTLIDLRLIDLILGDLTPDTDSVFMEAVKGMFLSKVYDIFNH